MKGLLTLLGFAVFPAAAYDVSGTWKLDGDIQGMHVDRVCTIHQTENKITGTCKGAKDEIALAGEVEGNKVTWRYTIDPRVTLVFKGTVDAGAGMKGSIEIQTPSGNFTATPK